MRNYAMMINQDFKCGHCHYHVTSNSQFSGVQNRNHCPYCLWSKHVDLYRAGDRLSACKMPMLPVGLTVKRTHKKYTARNQGELMLIHCCTDCRSLSINRIAADDDTETIYRVYQKSLNMSDDLQNLLAKHDIALLGEQQHDFVSLRLFGSTPVQAWEPSMS